MRRFGITLAVIALIAGVIALPAAAAGDLAVREVDASQFPLVRLTVQGAADLDPRDFAVRENDRVVSDLRVVPLAESETRAAGVALVLDTSGSMRANSKIGAARQAADAFLGQKAARDQVALVFFSNAPVVVSNFTDDPEHSRGVLAGLQPSGETALWDAVAVAAELFADRPDLVPTIVVLSDGADTVSTRGPEEAIAAAKTVNARVYAVALEGGAESDAPALRRLAEATGGSFTTTTDPTQLRPIYDRIQAAISGQYELTWTSTADPGQLDLAVSAGGAVARASTTAGAVAGESTASPEVVVHPRTPGVFDGPFAQVAAAVLAFIAVGAFVGGIGMALLRERSDLSRTLRPHVGGGAAPEETGGTRSLVESAIVKRAVEATASLARQQGLLDSIETKLDQADLKLRPAEALFFATAATALLAVGALALDPLLAVLVLVLGLLLPMAGLNAAVARRRRAFTALLPDTLQLLASSLRAGYSLPQAFAAVASEAEEPMARELGRIVVEQELGRPLDRALDDAAARMGSPDFEWAVLAIKIQREVGGNLAELLTTVSETMVSRERLRREVRTLTAEGRMSTTFLLALPFIVGAVMVVRNPGYMNVLLENDVGRILAIGSLGLLVAGYFWMRKIVEIDL